MTTITLGDITIHRIVEQQAPFFSPQEFFPDLAPERLEACRHWLEPVYIDPATGKLVLCIQSHLVRTPHHNILVDTCVGNHKPRPRRPFWDMMAAEAYEQRLAATGLAVTDIDFVMCTHMHVDHVGWNTRLDNGRWVPTFPKARYLFADRELEHWTAREAEDAASCPWMTDSVLPIVEAGRAEIVRSDHQLNELVRLLPTPGHTIDHFSVHVGRPGHDAVITGDMIHSPIQARYPELGMMSDYDRRLSGETRRRIFSRFCDTATMLCVSHLPSPSAARVTRWEDGFRFVAA